MTLIKKIFDNGTCLVAASALLTLSCVSLIVCPTARAGSDGQDQTLPSSHQPTAASHTAMSLSVDDDGDELLEHWSDPKFSYEERFQIALIAGGLSIGAAAGAVRRRKLRRLMPND